MPKRRSAPALTCPACKEPAHLGGSFGARFASCRTCGLRGPMAGSPETATDYFNRLTWSGEALNASLGSQERGTHG